MRGPVSHWKEPAQLMAGVPRNLADNKEESRIYSADRTKVLCWDKSRDHSDMYDTDVEYEGYVWDVATSKQLEYFTDGYGISHWDGNRMQGSPVSSITFRGDGAAIIIKYEDGSAREIGLS